MRRNVVTWLRDAADVCSWAVYGAWILAIFIRVRHDLEIPELKYFTQFAPLVWLALVIVGLRRAKAKEAARHSKGPSPAQSAWGLALALGFGAAIFLFQDYREPSDATLPLTAIGVALVAGFFLSRFAYKHASEIGEARFGPDGKPLGPWKPPHS